MPMVATPPETRTHSCGLAYFKSAGTFDMRLLSQGVRLGSMRFSPRGSPEGGGGVDLRAGFDYKHAHAVDTEADRHRCYTRLRCLRHRVGPAVVASSLPP